jgi:uncharacterized protein (TIGR03437 family)
MKRNLSFSLLLGSIITMLSALSLLLCLQAEHGAQLHRSISAAAPLPRISQVSLALDKPAASALYDRIPLSFEAADGQADSGMEFISRIPGYWLGLGKEEIVVANRGSQTERGKPLRIRLLGARESVQLQGAGKLPGVTNYYVGNDPKKWRAGVSHFGSVEYRGLYQGVDAVFYARARELEFDFVLAPEANPGAIRMQIGGGTAVRLDANGDLVMGTGAYEVRFKRPEIFQDNDGLRRQIAGGFMVDGNTVGFRVGAYDRSRSLIIDPLLLYAGYLGGSGTDVIQAVDVDANGNVIVAGYTTSTDFPALNEEQSSNRGNSDGFVTKFNPTGATLLYSTYFGGAGADEFSAIAIDSTGSVWLAGDTNSANFPLATPLQFSIGSGYDAVLSRLNSVGLLQFSTYYGGNGDDFARAVAVDSTGVYLAGDTFSTNLPIGISAQTSYGGGTPAQCPVTGSGQPLGGDVFVLKLDSSGTSRIYATYLGGSGCEAGRGIAVDGAGNAYVTGATNSPNFPTVGPLQASLGGGSCTPFGGGAAYPCPDAFVAKLNSNGGALLYSTYLGGSGLDDAAAIALDSAGEAFVIGDTQSSNFPLLNPLQSSRMGTQDSFVSKINGTGSGLVYSTYFGGNNVDYGRAIKVDSTGRAFIAGFTSSSDLPLVSAIQSSLAGSFDLFVATFNPLGTALHFSTYYGSPDEDQAHGLVLDGSGNTWVVGHTQSSVFPTRGAPYQKASGGGIDGILLKIEPVAVPPPPPPPPPPSPTPAVSSGGVVNNASFAPAPAPVAPGSIAAVFGSDLNDGSSQQSSSFGADGKLVTSLGGASATINNIPTPMFYSFTGQLGVQIPFELAGQTTGTIVVTVAGQSSVPRTINLDATAPGIFTVNQQGTGIAAVLHQDGVTPVTVQNPAHPNEVVTLFGTGLGMLTPALATGAVSVGNRTVATPTVSIDGVQVAPDFSGAAPNFVGLNQINVRIPANTRTASDIPVVLTINGKQSNSVTIPVGP